MNTKSLFKNIKINQIGAVLTTNISSITFDSRSALKGSLFVAIKGVQSDGHDFIEAAFNNGCRDIVCENLPSTVRDNISYYVVEDSEKALAEIAKEFYGDPSSKIKLVGVTGTNGKTTVATLLYDLFSNMGYKVGLISTVIYRIGEKKIPSTHTTPDAISLNKMFVQMIADGCQYCFMEVSSHSIVQKRVWGLNFTGVLFSNITHDHLDYHKTFLNYINTKKELFDNLPDSSFAIYNSDDKNGAVMVQNCRAKKYSFALSSVADFKCEVLESHFEGTLLEIDGSEVWTRLIGDFNAYNILSIYAVASKLGVEKELLLTNISLLKSVDGRFEYLSSCDGITAIVDYAHTPDALLNVLETIRSIKKDKQKIICVVGCGGDRDKSKRPKMGSIALDNSNLVIFTSDNPRSERIDGIISDMLIDISHDTTSSEKYLVVTDRREAIKMAICMAKAENEDIILIAGKGHETYQEECGVKSYFSDKDEVMKLFKLV